MPVFRRKCKTTVYDAGFGQWNFRCSCGAHGQAIRARREIEEKARIHESANG